MTDIKSMGLYRNVERIAADLSAAGIDEGSALTVQDLTSYDQYHYEGTAAVDDACEFLGASPGRTILDVGAGLGGPARYIAERTGANVTALELQADLNDTAAALTRRCGLDHQVTHLAGDVLASVVPDAAFDGIVSMLCFLHIPERSTLFSQCARSLRPGGSIFIDDYFARGDLTAAEQRALAEKVYCPYVPTSHQYVSDLEAAGFQQVTTTDKTAAWSAFVDDRLHAFRGQRHDLVARYGLETVDSLDDFYGAVAELFAGGNLGGVRITAELSTDAVTE